jgi:hypothetical protein
MEEKKQLNQTLVFTAIDPHSKRQRSKKFSLGKHTKDQAIALGNAWRKEVQDGKHPYLPGKKKGLKTESSSDDEETSYNPMTLFKSESIDDLNTPDDKFGMSFLLLGATRSGKSTLMLHLWEKFFKNQICILHTASHQSEIYKPLAKGVAVAPMFCAELITETSKINGATNNHYKFCHIIDDVVDKKNNKELIKLLTIGRNHRLSTVITGQELSIFNAIGRSNINFVCLFKLGSDMAIEKVIKQYLRSSFPSDMALNDMIKVYKKVTNNHGFFCIDNLNDKVFVSRLDDV